MKCEILIVHFSLLLRKVPWVTIWSKIFKGLLTGIPLEWWLFSPNSLKVLFYCFWLVVLTAPGIDNNLRNFVPKTFLQSEKDNRLLFCSDYIQLVSNKQPFTPTPSPPAPHLLTTPQELLGRGSKWIRRGRGE